jgi:hypothetical protein
MVSGASGITATAMAMARNTAIVDTDRQLPLANQA